MGMTVNNQIPDGNDHLTTRGITEWLTGACSAELQLVYQQHCIQCADCREQVAMISQSMQPDGEIERSPEYQELLRLGEQIGIEVWRQNGISRKEKLGWLNRVKIGPLMGWKLIGPLAAALLLGLGGWWIFSQQSPVNKGLEAMRLAWRNQRSGETRISAFQYAPWIQTRDDSDPVTDPIARERASSLLLSTVYEHPSTKAHQALGRFYLADRKFDKAIEQFEIVLKAQPNNAQAHSDLGAALMEKGKTALGKSQPGQSILEAAKALEHLNRALELDGSLLEAVFNRALCFQLMKLPPQKAREAWQQYLKQDANSPWAEEARKYLKLLEEQKEKTSLGREQLYQQFLDAWRAKDDDTIWQVVSQNRNPSDGGIEDKLTEAYLSASANEEIDKARSTLDMFRDLGALLKQRTGDRFTADLAAYYQQADKHKLERSSFARGLMKQAQAHLGKSEYGEAVRLFTEARTSFAEVGNECEALMADFRLGTTYVVEPRLELGEQVFNKLSATVEHRSYQWLAFNALSALANVKEEHNEFSQAVTDSQRSLAMANKLEDTAAIAQALVQLAERYRSLNQAVNSLDYLHRGLELAQKNSLSNWHRWIIYTTTGITLNAIHLNNAALQYQNEELRIAENTHNPLHISRAYTHLGQTYGRLGNYDKAISIIKSAWDVGEKLGQEKNGKGIMAHAALQLGHCYRQISNYPTAIEWYGRSFHLYEQLEFPHYQYITRKGELLARFAMPDDDATAQVLSEVLTLFDQYRGKIFLESQRNNFFDQEQSLYDVAIDFEYSHRHDQARAFEYSETCRARSLLDLLHMDKPTIKQEYGIDLELLPAATPLTATEIKRELPDEIQLLQYAVLNDKVLIWLITKNSLRARETVITNLALSKKVQRFRELISKPDESLKGELQQVASELYRLLLEPVETSLSPEKVICIIPDKSLQYLPFQALVSPATGVFLLEKFSLMYAASSSAFVTSTKTGKARSHLANERLLSIGNPEFDAARFPQVQSLPAAAREAGRIAAFYPVSRILIGWEANEKAVRKALPNAEIVHLATHYLADEQSVMASRLLLASDKSATNSSDSDGVMQNFEIYRLKWPLTKLVVLSACQTGIEQSFNGEGAFGAARPFIASGVPLVIASLWPVDSETTADLMIEFHRHRRRLKEPSVRALRQAQLSILHGSNERSRHPYFWASFSVLGGYAEF